MKDIQMLSGIIERANEHSKCALECKGAVDRANSLYK